MKKRWASYLLLFFLGVTPALAGKSSQKPRADLNIQEMASVQLSGNIYRALKGYDEIYPFLVIEKIRPSLTEGDKPVLAVSWSLKDMPGAQTLQLSSEGVEIKDLKWNGKELEFVHSSSGGQKSCKISKIVEGNPTISCQTSKKNGELRTAPAPAQSFSKKSQSDPE